MKEIELVNIHRETDDGNYLSSSKIVLGYSGTQLKSIEFIYQKRNVKLGSREYSSYKIIKNKGSIIDDFVKPRNLTLCIDRPDKLPSIYPYVELDIDGKDYAIKHSPNSSIINTFRPKSHKFRIFSCCNDTKLAFLGFDDCDDNTAIRFENPVVITSFLVKSFHYEFDETGFLSIDDIINYLKKMKSVTIVIKSNEQIKDEIEEEERRRMNMTKKNVVKVVNKWPQYVFPGPRKRYMAPRSGQEFREDCLTELINEKKPFILDMSGMVGYPPSWLEEVFGGMVRHFDESQIEYFKGVTGVGKDIIEDIDRYIKDAKRKKKERAENGNEGNKNILYDIFVSKQHLFETVKNYFIEIFRNCDGSLLFQTMNRKSFVPQPGGGVDETINYVIDKIMGDMFEELSNMGNELLTNNLRCFLSLYMKWDIDSYICCGNLSNRDLYLKDLCEKVIERESKNNLCATFFKGIHKYQMGACDWCFNLALTSFYEIVSGYSKDEIVDLNRQMDESSSVIDEIHETL